MILRPLRPSRRWILAVAAAALLTGGGGAVWLRSTSGVDAARQTTVTVPRETIGWGDEAAIRAHSADGLAIFRFSPNPRVVVLDFPDLGSQGRTLNRIAAWAEKANVPHDRILNEAELAEAVRLSGATPDTFYYGHDYDAATLTGFFARAAKDRMTLRPEEEWLRRLLAQAASEPLGVGAVISLTRAGSGDGVSQGVRAVILHHELSHGEYFTNADYARFVASVWRDVLTETERAAFRDFLRRDGYDTGLEDLMMNEMQAYLMHTPDARFFDPAALGIAPARVAAIRAAFADHMPSGWLRDVTPGRTRAPRRRSQGRSSSNVVSTASVPPRRRKSSAAA